MLLLFQASSFVYAWLDIQVVNEVRLMQLQDHYQFLVEFVVLKKFVLLYVEFQLRDELLLDEKDVLIIVELFYVQLKKQQQHKSEE
jgi:hypothetical protein